MTTRKQSDDLLPGLKAAADHLEALQKKEKATHMVAAFGLASCKIRIFMLGLEDKE